jgi:translation initiation factor 1
MNKKEQKGKTLNWEQFAALGNPENSESIENEQENDEAFEISPNKQRIRIFLDRKKRKGKGVTIIDGLMATEDYLEDITREFKKKCGVGGAVKEGQIIIQGDHRNKLKDLMIEKGFRDTKVSGA